MHTPPGTADTRLQDLIDASPDALVIVDVSGAVALVNRGAERLLGYDRDELLGRSFTDLMSSHERQASADLLAESVHFDHSSYGNPGIEVVAQHKNGADIPVEVSLNGLETGGRKLVVAAVRDISARRRMEQERLGLLALEQSARAAAEAAVRLRDAFLATVIHDLKQPLTIIKVRANLINELASELGGHPTGEQIRHVADRIAATSTSMATVLQELVDVSRLQVGQPLTLERKPVDLVALARQVASELDAPEQTPIHVHVASEQLIGLWDENQLERVLHNLLGNALKYSPQGGEVIVNLSRTEDSAVLAVSDHGMGIPPADLERVFEWFRRGSNVAGVAPGTGLGLAGVRQIVEQHGGSIVVTSEEGQGSTFTVRLPLGH